MVSKRQKLAKQKLKEEKPELFPKPEATPPSLKTKKKKNRPNKFKKGSKHPLRVPGMRPGESCYICKAKDHIAKLCPEKAEWEKNKICLLCRRRGHSLKNCPNKNEETNENKFCYNCGEAGHSLSNCSQPLQDGGTKFASCFICNERGHLSKNCPKNTHGIYPKGGSCKICGGVTHLARDCPNKVNRNSITAYGAANVRIGSQITQKPTRIVFGGDDLDDDFTAAEANTSTDKDMIVDATKTIQVKPKKKQGPKVVNFLG
ncbi:hypothetical protein IFM89_002543 [Coptis chinensis]|uniref:CCHC-type domain-containing protein n=1 Tax=Coptis chinensis TaxID=261450 RepID=A0A835LM64_9MAGN|nr:hypothetical protein IFM89_002543 [Coptis chinensis]